VQKHRYGLGDHGFDMGKVDLARTIKAALCATGKQNGQGTWSSTIAFKASVNRNRTSPPPGHPVLGPRKSAHAHAAMESSLLVARSQIFFQCFVLYCEGAGAAGPREKKGQRRGEGER
jgi:hypothetical protein